MGPGGKRIGALEYEDVARGRRSRFRAAPAARRVGRDRAQLHLRHHRQPQGRRLPPPRRLSERASATCWSGRMPQHPVYLWTLPMFHCNGWSLPVDAGGDGRHQCVPAARRVEGDLRRDRATTASRHFCGAPIVLNLLINAPADERKGFDRKVEVMTAASAPPAAVIEKMERMGFHITHVYGLTEVYGPAVVCEWHDEWNAAADRGAGRAQGAPGRALPGARRPDGRRSRRRWSRCRPTARRSARSSCAATSS